MTSNAAVARQSPSLLSLENPQHRLGLFAVLIAAALLSPDIYMPDPLPAIRLEQIILGLALPSIFLFHLRNREYLRLTALDVIFLLLSAAITTSIILAPRFVPSVSMTLRDPFEVARVVEYWLMYRFGMTLLPSERSAKTILATLFAASIFMTVFSVIQYLDGRGQFNEKITDIWAVGHNLVGVQREGRVIGTIGNANYYSFFMALPIIGSLAIVLLKKDLSDRNTRIFVIAAIVCSVVSAVLSQSRTGAASILFGMFIGLVLVLVWRRPAAPVKAIGLFLGSIALAVLFIQIQPPLVDSFNNRFNPAKVDEDASFIIRIQRFKTFFTGFFSEQPAFCEGDGLDNRIVGKSHARRPGAYPSTAGADVLARDKQRKEDVVEITDGVLAYFCDEGEWPAGGDLSAKLVPKFVDQMPKDPQTGKDYLFSIDPSGFWVGAKLEDPADPDGPNYALGTNPNIIRKSSFEENIGSGDWSEVLGSTRTQVNDGLYGDKALKITLPPGSDVRQYVIFDFPLDTVHTASAWIRSTSGKDEQTQFYLFGQIANGQEHDPVNYLIPQEDGSLLSCKDGKEERLVEPCRGVFTAPASGQWVPISVTFRTDPKERFTVVAFMFRAWEGNTSEILVDGASLTQGTFAPPYTQLSDVDPAELRPVDLPQFSDSPYVGVGPRNNAEAGSFDNEYVLFLDRYGLLGAGPYLAMYFAAATVAIRAWRKRTGWMDVMGLTGFAFTMTLFLFNVGAGSFYHFAIMAIYWLFIGYLATAKKLPSEQTVREAESAPSNSTSSTTRPSGSPEPTHSSAVKRG